MSANCPYVYDINGMRLRLDSVSVLLKDSSGKTYSARLSTTGGLVSRAGVLYVGIKALAGMLDDGTAVAVESKKNTTDGSIEELAVASAKAAIRNLNTLYRSGYGTNEIRSLPREQLADLLLMVAADGSATLSEHLTHDGHPVVRVTSAAMAKTFMSLGYNVDLVSDDPYEAVILENSLNDLQYALRSHANTAAASDDALRQDHLFGRWASKRGVNLMAASHEELKELAREFASNFELNMCLYYKDGINVFCGGNIGVARHNMPQISGPISGTSALISRAMRSGLVGPDTHYVLNRDSLVGMDATHLERAEFLALNPEEVLRMVREGDLEVYDFLELVDWSKTGGRVDDYLDDAMRNLGVVIEPPRFIDPSLLLSSQNELQGTMVEEIADRAIKACDMLTSEILKRGETPTTSKIAEILSNKYLRTEVYGVIDPDVDNPDFSVLLWEETMTAGRPGTHHYMLDGHHRWVGIMLANRELAQRGVNYRLSLKVRNYQTDIREALEIGRAVQVAFGIKDAKVSGEDGFLEGDDSLMTPGEFQHAVSEATSRGSITRSVESLRRSGRNPFREVKTPSPLTDAPIGGVLNVLSPPPTLSPSCGQSRTSVNVIVSTEDGPVATLINPFLCSGRGGRESFDSSALNERTTATSSLAREQLRTLPYGRENMGVAVERVLWALEHTDDGDVAKVLSDMPDRHDLVVLFSDPAILGKLASLSRSRDISEITGGSPYAHILS